MLATAKSIARRFIRPSLSITWLKRGGWLDSLPSRVPAAPQKALIEARADKTEARGAMALHEAYGQAGATRRPDDVRSGDWAGDLYAWLAAERRPKVIVEFGSAFGVSGMYWLAGLRDGWLYSWEINPEWAAIARENMAAIGGRCTLTVGAFEDRLDVLAGQRIDIALVDGIHKREFILRQYDILRTLAAPGALLLFDDIDFGSGDMRQGWEEIAGRPEVVAACEINGHLGIMELR